jgi:glutamine cyclotransferase
VRFYALLFAVCALAQAAAPVYGYKVVKTYPHDRAAFTQGLQYTDGIFYEGTGLNGRSSIRKVELATGKVLQLRNVDRQYFGEGIVTVGNELFELTWQHGVMFVYDKNTFNVLRTYTYQGEGWGLTTDGASLVMSDGTSAIRFIDPKTGKETRRIKVTDGAAEVTELNELEYIKGEIWANIWQTDRIARIDPKTGKVNSYLDLRGILGVMDSMGTDVLNGIAYDAKTDRIWVTGKLWPKIFEIQVGTKK